ncbi:MAG: glycerophosphodiester phosphodiesterase [Flavobacteriales bacterium]|nr:MAG: glycerophosphodiester phosphodiesterase [Flavobacteriales bacterium]
MRKEAQEHGPHLRQLQACLVAAVLSCSFACNMPEGSRNVEVHGHRGCRGLLPENTVPAFLKATELGCHWLELDVVLNAEGQVVVSHEPWMDHRICLDPNGQRIDSLRERDHNIQLMTQAEVMRYDCGSLPHPDFPQQVNSRQHKPLLREVVDSVRRFAAERGLRVPRFNVEVKSEPELYHTHQPTPDRYTGAVLGELRALGIDKDCLVQSFDPAVLNAVHALAPEVATALLVDNADGAEANLARIAYRPAVYSPAKELVTPELLALLRARGIGIAVWTVNDTADMRRFIGMGVDGIITDYPDRLLGLLR